MNLTQKQIIIIAGAVVFVIVVFFVISANIRSSTKSQEVSLKIWGVDDAQVMEGVFQSYHAVRPNVTVLYTQVPPKNFHDSLLNALAAGEGPDVFYIGNRELPKEKDKLAPAIPAQMDIVKFRELFPMAAEQDFVLNGQIYAVPLYMDTLALFYNKDFFDQAGIVAPPKTWDEFQKDVVLLRKVNQNGQIARAATALGGSEDTVDSAVDILNLLMLQNGAQMVSPDFSSATFNAYRGSGNPGLSAFNFYLQFANAASPYYTWNDGQTKSLDNFVSGKTAMVLDYQAAIATIKNKSPFLNFAVAPVPQPTGADINVNYPKYHGLVISKQSKVGGWGWDLAIYLATNQQAQKTYLAGTGRPPALRSFIAGSLNDPVLGVFAKSALIARSWYEADNDKINDIFNGAIKNVLTGLSDSKQALAQAQDQVGQLMKR